MESLFRKFEKKVENTYIIYLPQVSVSNELSVRCMESCRKVGQPAVLWEGFDGTRNKIIVPEHLKNQMWYKWLKIFDHQLSVAEVATCLSHISLWVRCMEIDQPIVILEHDAIMLKKFSEHTHKNCVHYLGCKDQHDNLNLKNVQMFSSINHNWQFIHRAHAYCIDPHVAKKLFMSVLDRGIYESLDIMIRLEDVAIFQDDLYAYDEPGETTIKTRKKG